MVHVVVMVRVTVFGGAVGCGTADMLRAFRPRVRGSVSAPNPPKPSECVRGYGPPVGGRTPRVARGSRIEILTLFLFGGKRRLARQKGTQARLVDLSWLG
jgi:hypothetical protein